jgi:hypothetical protein
MAISSAQNMFCRPGSRSVSSIFFIIIYTVFNFFSFPNVSYFFWGGVKGTVCVEVVFGGEFEWCFVL